MPIGKEIRDKVLFSDELLSMLASEAKEMTSGMRAVRRLNIAWTGCRASERTADFARRR